MTIFVGLDDTDTLETRGTGHLARAVAAALADYRVLGVVRHQLLVDPRVPCTKNNSSATLLVEDDGHGDPARLAERVRAMMLADFVVGSDPGLCVAVEVPAAVSDFGRRAQRELVSQAEARALAREHGIWLEGLGGTQDGVIGALASVGLSATGEAGRYVWTGRMRDLSGLQPVAALLAAGIASVQTTDGRPVEEGMVSTDRLRPARRGGRPVAVVEWAGDHWLPLKLD